ncbi:sensor histidine kinase [Mesorhizobium marinum]|uniref:histidine kinase n=1 Tax=Mesorhizobium marinum TaxID=3228790 RepID=A0ABV3QXM7_9HYPH
MSLGNGGKGRAALNGDKEIAFGLSRALRNTAVSVLYQSPDMRVAWAQNIPSAWSNDSIVGLTDDDFLPAQAAGSLKAAKRSALEGSQSGRLEICIPNGAGDQHEQWFDLWIDVDKAPDGTVKGIVTTAVEITEQRRREQTLRVLLREVSHRSRNLLAIIQSIATQTGRYASSIEAFLSRFRDRLQSLASSQDLVTSSNWRGADLGELVHGQAARYSATPGSAVRLEGDRPWLNPNAALHVGLALHELIANSVSYGALSRPGGHVSLSAKVARASTGDPSLLLLWTETIGSPEQPVGQVTREKNFGSVALERVVPASLGGSATLNIEDGVLEYRLAIPSGNFEPG